uniref:S-adenosyl-L-methionine-dependent methyltransferase n=1 Tax=Strongyloides venezuelensis TaxID=75913 RepID=A0A0K0FDF3_STRVS
MKLIITSFTFFVLLLLINVTYNLKVRSAGNSERYKRDTSADGKTEVSCSDDDNDRKEECKKVLKEGDGKDCEFETFVMTFSGAHNKNQDINNFRFRLEKCPDGGSRTCIMQYEENKRNNTCTCSTYTCKFKQNKLLRNI